MEREKVKDLILWMLYENSWEEKILGETVVSAWKGYPFEALNELEDEEMLYQTRRSKSVRLSEAGIEKARMIQKLLEELDWE